MKKVFISQPMRGKTDEEILTVRKKAIESAEKLIGEPVEVIDSFFSGRTSKCKAIMVFGKILRIVSNCRCGVFCRGME